MGEFLASIQIDPLSGLLALVAVVVSALTWHRSSKSEQRAHHKREVSEQFSQFSDFNKMRLQYPFQSHLMELPAHYEQVKRIISTASRPSQQLNVGELVIQERAVALLIFSIYEKLCYDLALAEEEGSEGRTKFLSEVIEYFHTKWLQNPRLLYFWSPQGGDLRSLFEQSTCRTYDTNVIRGRTDVAMDAEGPFPYEVH